jgi:hypothetical protein
MKRGRLRGREMQPEERKGSNGEEKIRFRGFLLMIFNKKPLGKQPFLTISTKILLENMSASFS